MLRGSRLVLFVFCRSVCSACAVFNECSFFIGATVGDVSVFFQCHQTVIWLERFVFATVTYCADASLLVHASLSDLRRRYHGRVDLGE